MPKNFIPNLPFSQPALREVSLKTAKVNGINLGQGVCRMPVPSLVIEAAQQALAEGKNLYAPAVGIKELKDAIALKLNSFNKAPYKSENVIVTNGSTGAFEALCDTYLNPGDEVICFSPFYPYHHNALTRKGAVIRYVELNSDDFSFDLNQVESACSVKTKFLLLTSPNNPTGKVFTQSELEGLGEICTRRDLICVTDEVYEYMTYDGRKHISIASLPSMFERTITMSSYSKTFAITGWRIGYLAAPVEIAIAVAAVVDNIYVCAPTPFQYAVARGISELGESYYSGLLADYSRKRELMRKALIQAGFVPHLPQGAYYMLADIRERFPGKSSEEVLDIMIQKAQVGAVPAADFVGTQYKGDPKKSTFFRFCYAVPDEWLIRAGENLGRL